MLPLPARSLDDLERTQGVLRVHYPGLPSHPQHALCQRQMAGGAEFLRLNLRAGQVAKHFLSGLRIFTLAESLGGWSLWPSTGAHDHASFRPPGARNWAFLTVCSAVVGIRTCRGFWADLNNPLGCEGSLVSAKLGPVCSASSATHRLCPCAASTLDPAAFRQTGEPETQEVRSRIGSAWP